MSPPSSDQRTFPKRYPKMGDVLTEEDKKWFYYAATPMGTLLKVKPEAFPECPADQDNKSCFFELKVTEYKLPLPRPRVLEFDEDF